MADFEYDEVAGSGELGRGFDVAGLVNWAGAVISIGLIAGLGWWGYQLMVRDVTGVPVIKSLAGPMRSAPEEPGGLAAEYQGLAVNNIAAEGEAEPPPDKLVLAPRPMALTTTDMAPREVAAIAAEQAAAVAAEAAAIAAAERVAAQAAAAAAESDNPEAGAIELALLEALNGDAEAGEPVPSQAETVMLASTSAEAVLPPGAISASVSGVSQSPVPKSKPQNLSPVAVAPTVSSQGPVAETDPATIPAGTRLAQLGAFDTPEAAGAEWDRLAVVFEEVMADKSRVIQSAQSGGKTFFRLRAAGFGDISDARRFCSILLVGQATCIPVITR